jgi:hypothetical protein
LIRMLPHVMWSTQFTTHLRTVECDIIQRQHKHLDYVPKCQEHCNTGSENHAQAMYVCGPTYVRTHAHQCTATQQPTPEWDIDTYVSSRYLLWIVVHS